MSGADERSPRALWVKAALLVVGLGTGLVTWLVAGTSDVASLQAATRGWDGGRRSCSSPAMR